jgi:2'-5' RNA ligase
VPSLIAIDVAILPPREICEGAMALSASLPRTEFQGLQLDETHLPHITLTQQYVAVDELAQVTAAIGRMVAGHPRLALAISGAGRGTNSVWMRVDRAESLHTLHRALMDALLPFEHRGGAVDAFAEHDARLTDVQWVAQYRGTSSYERFTPHITLGHASRLPRVDPMTFEADVVAMCHLGRFCSCRKVLYSWRMPDPLRGIGPPGTAG